MDVILGKARRRWEAEEKRALVAETFLPGNSVNGVARRHQISPTPSMLFNWRKRFRDGPRLSAAPLDPRPIPVVVAPEQTAVAARSATISEKIEIDVAGKYRIRVSGYFEEQVLRRVLDVLERRCSGTSEFACLAGGRTNRNEELCGAHDYAQSVQPLSASTACANAPNGNT
jgi:transposase